MLCFIKTIIKKTKKLLLIIYIDIDHKELQAHWFSDFLREVHSDDVGKV